MGEAKEELIKALIPKVEEYCSLAWKMGEVWASIAQLAIGKRVLTGEELKDKVYRPVFEQYDETNELNRIAGDSLMEPLSDIVGFMEVQEEHDTSEEEATDPNKDFVRMSPAELFDFHGWIQRRVKAYRQRGETPPEDLLWLALRITSAILVKVHHVPQSELSKRITEGCK
jgi:hypothetical protein